jgi:hypothetical protein
MRSVRFSGRGRWGAALAALVGGACSEGSMRADVSLDGTLQDGGADAPALDASLDAPFEASADAGVDGLSEGGEGGMCPVARVCGAACCAVGDRCHRGACVRDLGPCAVDDECQTDSYCEEGSCVPYGAPRRTVNDRCEMPPPISPVAPAVQCRWTAPPAGDPYPSHVFSASTPVVVDLDADDDPTTVRPSIAFVSYANSTGGVLRVVDGGTCAQMPTTADASALLAFASSLAAADLDGDGRPEIVGIRNTGSLVAFRYDRGSGRMAPLWQSARCAGGMRLADDAVPMLNEHVDGVSIHDLDDDGQPEILRGRVVYDGRTGCIRTSAEGYGYPGLLTAGGTTLRWGHFPVVADVDDDPRAELVEGDRILEWNPMASAWQREAYLPDMPMALAGGHVALGDFGGFAGMPGAPADAEVVVVSPNAVRVQTREGRVVFGPFTVPGRNGGPPTVGDFDGDGRPEFATATSAALVVYDLDCVRGGDPAGCGGMSRTDGILWQRPSQDVSSGVTGASVFDFNADGRAEVVYADECFLRVYDGRDGRVLYSVARASGTGYENAIVADVNGNRSAEIVVTLNSSACPATDPLFPSARFSSESGLLVLRDAAASWANSRPIWNQHAYHVTHVTERGTIPRTSVVTRNWRAAGLNTFRANTQGMFPAFGLADLTVRPAGVAMSCRGLEATVPVTVCNRGRGPANNPARVRVRAGGPMGPEVCAVTAPAPIESGACVDVRCTGTLRSLAEDLHVTVDDDGAQPECVERNNRTVLAAPQCATPG